MLCLPGYFLSGFCRLFIVHSSKLIRVNMEASGRDGVNFTLLSEQNSTHKLETGHILIKWSKFEVIRRSDMYLENHFN